jgi:hypothetical protein
MNIIGNKNDIAIEYSIDTRFTSYYYGNFRLWLDNNQIGDVSVDALFSIPLGDLKILLNEPDRFNSKELFLVNEIELFNIARQAKKDEVSSFERFEIFNGESFDDYYVLCFYNTNKYKFVWQDIKNNSLVFSSVKSMDVIKKIFDDFVRVLP